ncbi:MAG: hypothetical protein ACOY5V_02290 [Pseudomonadota bacterium]
MTTLQIFDVEHGGCALLTCRNGMRMMIDCGHNATLGWYPGNHLGRPGVQHLEMLVVTNYDQDRSPLSQPASKARSNPAATAALISAPQS